MARSVEYRDRCFEEYEEKCHFCGREEQIEVHHIDGDSSNNSAENLLPVCRKHHIEIHTEGGDLQQWTDKIEHAGPYNPASDSYEMSLSINSSLATRFEAIEASYLWDEQKAIYQLIADYPELVEKTQRVAGLESRVNELEAELKAKDEMIDRLTTLLLEFSAVSESVLDEAGLGADIQSAIQAQNSNSKEFDIWRE